MSQDAMQSLVIISASPKGRQNRLALLEHLCYFTLVNVEQLPFTRHKLKRKRGGQKGNQNARKHGFYSGTLSVAEICEFWNITNLEGVDPAIAVLRLKLQSLLQHDPGNRRVLREASKLLAKWFRTKYRLDRTDSNYLKMVIESILEHYLGASNCQTDQPTSTNG